MCKCSRHGLFSKACGATARAHLAPGWIPGGAPGWTPGGAPGYSHAGAPGTPGPPSEELLNIPQWRSRGLKCPCAGRTRGPFSLCRAVLGVPNEKSLEIISLFDAAQARRSLVKWSAGSISGWRRFTAQNSDTMYFGPLRGMHVSQHEPCRTTLTEPSRLTVSM